MYARRTLPIPLLQIPVLMKKLFSTVWKRRKQFLCPNCSVTTKSQYGNRIAASNLCHTLLFCYVKSFISGFHSLPFHCHLHLAQQIQCNVWGEAFQLCLWNGNNPFRATTVSTSCQGKGGSWFCRYYSGRVLKERMGANPYSTFPFQSPLQWCETGSALVRCQIPGSCDTDQDHMVRQRPAEVGTRTGVVKMTDPPGSWTPFPNSPCLRRCGQFPWRAQ